MRRRLLICFRKIQSLEQILTCRLPGSEGLLPSPSSSRLLLPVPLPEALYVPVPEFDNEPEVDETVKEAPPSLDLSSMIS